ncbi:ATP synthase F1 subunit delta [Erysipelothrix sp. HDW6B]|uniref:ATP synthase F1 subunit delta n=1 Tax=Erysipelothrix sp. HDW6B TaxID=2714929 RepID=UPI00140AE9F7|nr:ATP synthase F1 subunit delta [Erysipelothrix sp. HDW6B]QIK85683.1 ATP synthase F1 subunit delta [Erysipelothrix sp. HDW6B]
MIISTKQYAQALFEVSQEQNVVMDVYAELQVVSLILEDEKINRIFTRTYQDETILDPLWKTLRSHFSKQVVNFLQLLYQANMMKSYERVMAAFRDLLEIHEYLSRVDVVSAIALSDQEKISLQKTLKEKYKGDLEMHYEIDANLLQGMIVHVRSDIYDTSVKSKLDRIINQGGLQQ